MYKWSILIEPLTIALQNPFGGLVITFKILMRKFLWLSDKMVRISGRIITPGGRLILFNPKGDLVLNVQER